MTDLNIQGCILHWILHIFPVIVTTVSFNIWRNRGQEALSKFSKVLQSDCAAALDLDSTKSQLIFLSSEVDPNW